MPWCEDHAGFGECGKSDLPACPPKVKEHPRGHYTVKNALEAAQTREHVSVGQREKKKSFHVNLRYEQTIPPILELCSVPLYIGAHIINIWALEKFLFFTYRQHEKRNGNNRSCCYSPLS